uniref:Uncharacterized protein n=1 Tax=Arion vulgaris TaxID=1028688 RepID=A0A0B7A054_9EUPU
MSCSSSAMEKQKNITKGHYKAKWKKEHPKRNMDDGYYQLTKRDQSAILCIWTGHNIMRH